MLLTNKAKEDFERWLYSNDVLIKDGIYDDTYLTDVFEELPLNLQYASIIEWFDSVGIYVNSSGLTLSKAFISDVSVDNNCEYNYDGFRTRKEALIEAIKKANEIYNEKK